MATEKLKPTSAGQRHVQRVKKPAELHKGKPHKSRGIKKSGGRNNNGRITSRHKGGGHKQRYRDIDFKRDKIGIPGRVERIEYDPNRTVHLALILYTDGERRYISAPRGIKVGDPVISGPESPIKVGNSLPLENIPLGTTIHNIEMKPGKGAQMIRTAGGGVPLLAKDAGYATVKLRSGEVRKVLLGCYATIGTLGNEDHNLESLGKAGASRWRGRRPHVRGVAMNPVDHPMGGGEGRSSGGRHPVSPWGQTAKGGKTSTRKKRGTAKHVVRRRNEGK